MAGNTDDFEDTKYDPGIRAIGFLGLIKYHRE